MVKRSVWMGVGTLVLAGGLLAACGDDTEENANDLSSENTVTTAETDDSGEAVEAVEIFEDSGSEIDESLSLEEQIVQYFVEYELPDGGYDEDNVTIYENDLYFNRMSKGFMGIKDGASTDELRNVQPLPGQEPGIAWGYLRYTDFYTPIDKTTEEGMNKNHKMVTELLIEARKVNDFEPLNQWLSDRINVLENAAKIEDYSERRSVLMREDDVIYSLFSDVNQALKADYESKQ